MKVYENKTFDGLSGREPGATVSELEFRRCSFEGCYFTTMSPSTRSIVRNLRLYNCEQRGCSLDGAIVEDVLLDGLKTYTLLQTWATVFKHVTLRGRIGQIMTSPSIAPASATPEEQRAFDEANAAYYAKVDWALDISEAEFQDEPDFRGIPARLFRRDPKTQVVVKREKVIRGRWRGIDLSGTCWPTSLELLLDFEYDDVVLVAPKRDKTFRTKLEGLIRLREAGIAEPD